MGSWADHDKSRHEAYSVKNNILQCQRKRIPSHTTLVQVESEDGTLTDSDSDLFYFVSIQHSVTVMYIKIMK